MKSPDVPKALVTGGSLGGLFAATALRAIGWQVDIYERSPAAMDSRGGGIVLQADVLHHFRYAGIHPAGALGVRSHDRLYLDRAGSVMHKEPMPKTQTSRRSHSLPPGALATGQDTYIRERGEQQANPVFRVLIRQTKDIFVQVILDLKVPQMVFGRVLLTGDAAFVPRPHTAGCTAKAARNALSLAQAIDDIGDIDNALLAWQQGKRMGDWGGVWAIGSWVSPKPDIAAHIGLIGESLALAAMKVGYSRGVIAVFLD